MCHVSGLITFYSVAWQSLCDYQDIKLASKLPSVNVGISSLKRAKKRMISDIGGASHLSPPSRKEVPRVWFNNF